MAQMGIESMRHKIEVTSVVMGGLTMASVARCLHIRWDAAPSARTNAESVLLAAMWAPLVAFLCSTAVSRYTAYRSHAFAWWWVLLARCTITICDALLCVCATNVRALYFHLWLRYFISGVWFGVGGWLPSLMYYLWSFGSMSTVLANIHELLSFARVLGDLKGIATATEIYFAAVIFLLAQEDWPSAFRVLFGVGTGLCAGVMLLTVLQQDVYVHVFSHFGMTEVAFQELMQSIHNQAIYLAIIVFGLHLITRFYKRV